MVGAGDGEGMGDDVELVGDDDGGHVDPEHSGDPLPVCDRPIEAKGGVDAFAWLCFWVDMALRKLWLAQLFALRRRMTCYGSVSSHDCGFLQRGSLWDFIKTFFEALGGGIHFFLQTLQHLVPELIIRGTKGSGFRSSTPSTCFFLVLFCTA